MCVKLTRGRNVQVDIPFGLKCFVDILLLDIPSRHPVFFIAWGTLEPLCQTSKFYFLQFCSDCQWTSPYLPPTSLGFLYNVSFCCPSFLYVNSLMSICHRPASMPLSYSVIVIIFFIVIISTSCSSSFHLCHWGASTFSFYG